MIGTGAIARMHARVYKKIGYELTVCTDTHEPTGRRFAEEHGVEFVPDYRGRLPRTVRVDYVDVCTFPDFRLEPVEICARAGKHVQVQKPISTNLDTRGA
jgi:UDP-N-acetyl-2-amino-2-deoxyglucuronate dehydrogenase